MWFPGDFVPITTLLWKRKEACEVNDPTKCHFQRQRWSSTFKENLSLWSFTCISDFLMFHKRMTLDVCSRLRFSWERRKETEHFVPETCVMLLSLCIVILQQQDRFLREKEANKSSHDWTDTTTVSRVNFLVPLAQTTFLCNFVILCNLNLYKLLVFLNLEDFHVELWILGSCFSCYQKLM